MILLLSFYLLSSMILSLFLKPDPDPILTATMSLLSELKYIQYSHGLEAQYLPSIRALISKDLSEPYSIYVYRYFLYQWGHLCFMVCTNWAPSPQALALDICSEIKPLIRPRRSIPPTLRSLESSSAN